MWRTSRTTVAKALTAYFQTELAINTNEVATNTNVAVSDVHRDVLTTKIIVSDIHRTIVESQEGADGKDRSVSVILLLSSLPNQRSLLPRANLGWWSQLLVNPASHTCI